MQAGEAKTTATKEMEAAQQMMAKNDREACKSHLHSAMEATEKSELRPVAAYTHALRSFGAKRILRLPNSSGSSSTA